MSLDEETFGPAKQGAHILTDEPPGHPRLDYRNGNVESSVARLADDGGQCRDVANDEAAPSGQLAFLLSVEESFGGSSELLGLRAAG